MPDVYVSDYTLGKKAYEVKDHLGNVRAVVSDKRNYLPSSEGSQGKDWVEPGRYFPVVLNRMDYYPFGLQRMKDSTKGDTCQPWRPFNPGSCGLAQRNDWQPGSSCCMSMEVGDLLQVTFNDSNLYRFSFDVNLPNGVKLVFKNKGTNQVLDSVFSDGNHSFTAPLNTTLQIVAQLIDPNQGAFGTLQFCNFNVETYDPSVCLPCTPETILNVIANDLNDELPEGWTYENQSGKPEDMFTDCNGRVFNFDHVGNMLNFTLNLTPGKRYKLKLTNCDTQDALMQLRIVGLLDTTFTPAQQVDDEIIFTATQSTHEFYIVLQDGTYYYLSHLVVTADCPTLEPMQAYRYKYNGKELLPRFGGQYDYGFRMYNAGLGRFLSVDPLTKKYPELTPYQFASNTPIQAIDLDGLEAYYNKDGRFIKWGINKSKDAPVIVVSGNKEIQITLNYQQLWDRAHWIYGEGRGEYADYYAHTIENIRENSKSEKSIYLNLRDSKFSGKDEFFSEEIPYANYSNFQKIKFNDDKLAENQEMLSSFKAVLDQQTNVTTDPTNGANEWRGYGSKTKAEDSANSYLMKYKEGSVVIGKKAKSSRYHIFRSPKGGTNVSQKEKIKYVN